MQTRRITESIKNQRLKSLIALIDQSPYQKVRVIPLNHNKLKTIKTGREAVILISVSDPRYGPILHPFLLIVMPGRPRQLKQ